jgi:hypothetical protein
MHYLVMFSFAFAFGSTALAQSVTPPALPPPSYTADQQHDLVCLRQGLTFADCATFEPKYHANDAAQAAAIAAFRAQQNANRAKADTATLQGLSH